MRRAFTLIELVMVLVVLAIVTHLAVHELGSVLDGKRTSAAETQLESIRRAAADFLSDVGRLPRLVAETNDQGQVVKTLSELWRCPSHVPRQAVTNLDGKVMVATGWRGPYLRISPNKDRLLDPWSNAIEEVDDAGLKRLWMDEDGCVTNVCHYGARGQLEGRRDASLIPDGGARCSLVVTGANLDAAACRCYVPREGLVVGLLPTEATDAQVRFDGVVPGERVVTVTGTDGSSAVRLVKVRGPATVVEILP